MEAAESSEGHFTEHRIHLRNIGPPPVYTLIIAQGREVSSDAVLPYLPVILICVISRQNG